MHHGFPFDPGYGHSLRSLLEIQPPDGPADFETFWTQRYRRAREVAPTPRLQASTFSRPDFTVEDLSLTSTDGFPLQGWLLRPRHRAPSRAIICGHGYGGIERPDFDVPCADAVYLVLCFRGLARSARAPISSDPAWHVLHDIHDRERYILGGCVDDVWIAVTALTLLFPSLGARIGYMGISFGGGIGAMALAWDARIDRGHLNVPTFGHQPLRLQLPTVGSGAAVQAFARSHGHVLDTLAYYDAATAAQHIRQPMHVAAALFDPAVAPPGQFAIHNALRGDRRLFVLGAGHFDYPQRGAEDAALLAELSGFFGCDESGVSPLA